jgi:hypothetical protein
MKAHDSEYRTDVEVSRDLIEYSLRLLRSTADARQWWVMPDRERRERLYTVQETKRAIERVRGKLAEDASA